MKPLYRLVMSLVVVSSLAACGGSTPFSSPAGNFSVTFPAAPKEESQVLNTAIGAVTVHTFSCERGGRAYVVGYSDYPNFDNGVDKALDGARDGAVNSSQGKLLSEEILSFEGHPAREIRLEMAQGLAMRLRLIAVGTRLYQVGVVTPRDEASSPKIAEFLDTFHLSPGARREG